MKRWMWTMVALLALMVTTPAQAGFYPGQWSDWDWGWPGMIPLPDTDGWWRMQDLGFGRVVVQICYDIADDECVFDYCLCKLSSGTWIECPCQ